jgi:type II secretory pathway pseudopilin PulG
MGLSFVATRLKTATMNRNGFTFLMAIFMVMIIGIMLGLTGQSWKTIMKREREKELLFRGSQIKEAIENWNNPNFTVDGVKRQGPPHQLMELKDLLQDPYTLKPLRYLPQNYAAELDGKNPKCAPDCAKIKIMEDPMTGKEWTILRDNVLNAGLTTISTGTQGGPIIGVASISDEEPFKTDFKDTALENMGSVGVGATTGAAGTVLQVTTGTLSSGAAAPPPGLGGKMTKYSEWKFIAEPPEKNDHSKIYRAYHER